MQQVRVMAPDCATFITINDRLVYRELHVNYGGGQMARRSVLCNRQSFRKLCSVDLKNETVVTETPFRPRSFVDIHFWLPLHAFITSYLSFFIVFTILSISFLSFISILFLSYFLFVCFLVISFYYFAVYSVKKSKAIPLQTWTGPQDSRRLRFPDFKTVGTRRWQGC
jgi:hypothetical protein